MAYTDTDYKSKKSLLEDFDAGAYIGVWQPGPFGPDVRDGQVCIEGPQYPKPHRFYLSVIVEKGRIVEIVGRRPKPKPIETVAYLPGYVLAADLGGA